MPSITASGEPLNEMVPGFFEDQERQHQERLDKEESSAGISSSTSGNKPDKSGSSGTQDPRSPAPDVESHSGKDQPASQARSSSASSTDGSTPETGSAPQSLQASSEESAAATLLTPGLVPDVPEDPTSTAAEFIAAAHSAYEARDYDLAENLLAEAERLDPTVSADLDVAHAGIAAARAAAKEAASTT
jgi:hypothetical protein